MIASFSNNFIFLKTRKTAGTSVEIILSTWCSGGDLCAPISRLDEVTRAELGGHPSTAVFNGHRFFNHMPASTVRRLLPDLWNTAFKFTVERHPYEKLVSRAYWNIARRGGEPQAEFAGEVDRVLTDRSMYIDRPIYMIDEKIVVDEVVMYDQVMERLGELAVKFGKEMPPRIPRAKGQHRADPRPASELLSEAQKERIRSEMHWEFAEFGFEP